MPFSFWLCGAQSWLGKIKTIKCEKEKNLAVDSVISSPYCFRRKGGGMCYTCAKVWHANKISCECMRPSFSGVLTWPFLNCHFGNWKEADSKNENWAFAQQSQFFLSYWSVLFYVQNSDLLSNKEKNMRRYIRLFFNQQGNFVWVESNCWKQCLEI